MGLRTCVLHAMRIGRTAVQPQHRCEGERWLGELFELCLGFGELFARARQRLRQRVVLRLQAVVQLPGTAAADRCGAVRQVDELLDDGRLIVSDASGACTVVERAQDSTRNARTGRGA